MRTILAGFLAVLSIRKLRRVEAIYAEISTRGIQPILEKLIPALSRLPFFWKVPVRNFFRRKMNLETLTRERSA
ncbi:MAG: hypothetical protein HYU64_11245 [Armatimonadetes bacterium]|nr:hypothetical protein [Armatimonadota bacterium]